MINFSRSVVSDQCLKRGDAKDIVHILNGALDGDSGLLDYIPEPKLSGADAFQFKVDDGGVPPDGGDSNVATISIVVGTPQAVFGFDMEVDPGWSTEGQWAFGQPTGGGSHDGDPSAGHTGANVYGYNLNGDYPNNLPPMHLTTTALDCSQIIETELRFQRWLGVEWANFDHASVVASTDGNTWVTVWEHDGGAISDSSWVPQSFDISKVADGQPTVYLRWTMGPTDNFVTYPGWNIDDVEIWGVNVNLPCGDCPTDVNGSGETGAADLAVLLGSWGPCSPGDPCACLDANADETIGAADLAVLLGTWGPCPG